MKVKFTLEEKESQGIRQMLEDIPIDLCAYVNCPDMEGDCCENCPLRSIQEHWHRGLEQLCQQTCDALEKIEG